QKMRALIKDRVLRLAEVLTKEQHEKFAALQGTKFKVSQIRAPDDGRMGQRADPDFDVSISEPAYTDKHPTVLFDEAHRNYHTSSRGYNALADLMTNDGYQVSPGHEKFSSDQLNKYEILIIVNAPAGSYESQSAFSEDECDAVQTWVKAGGSLLLVS